MNGFDDLLCSGAAPSQNLTWAAVFKFQSLFWPAQSAITAKQRCLDDLLHKRIRIWSCDEEKAEGKDLNIRLYAAKERGIKKKDCHHRRSNNEKITLKKSGMHGALAALRLVCNNNKKPFSSGGFGTERAEQTGYYLTEFGPESDE